MIEGFNHKIHQFKEHCDKMNKNTQLKQIINSSKANYFKRKRMQKLQKNKRHYIYEKNMCKYLLVYSVFQIIDFIYVNLYI